MIKVEKCRFKSVFEYMYYNGSNKMEIEQVLRANGYDTMTIAGGLSNAIIFCKFDKTSGKFNSDVSVLNPEQYLVFYDTGTVGLMTKPEFEGTFEKIKDEEDKKS